ncbi:hypothetical protein [Streptomyces sp. DH8]|nr:hypothetical protein [Streptomyces sp. DH8]
MLIALAYVVLSLLVSSPFLVAVWRYRAGRMPSPPAPSGGVPR